MRLGLCERTVRTPQTLGDEVTRAIPTVALAIATLATSSANAADVALRTAVFASDDANDTTVLRTSAGALFGYAGPRHYQGLVLEDLRIRPLGGDRWDERRAYFAFARGEAIAWNGLVGTDGHTVLGSLSAVKEGAVRQEYFVERERLETPRGVQGDGLYHTFAGAAFDVPIGEGGLHQVTVLGGLQDFTGANLRSHLRARYVAVVVPEQGVSLQLRSRAFRNSEPFEADYYSPEWFVEIMPTLQVRRFRGGWMYSAAAGWGRQRDSESDWRQARLVEISVNSPQRGASGYLRLTALYSNTPVSSGSSYGYRQVSAAWVKPL